MALRGAFRVDELQLHYDYIRLTQDGSGNMIIVDNTITTGVKVDSLARKELMFFSADGQTTGTNVGGMDIYAPATLVVLDVHIAVDTAPTGAALTVDINKNGTTIFTTQSGRPSISAGSNSDTSSAPDVTAIAKNDIITFDIDQVGSTVPGSDLTVQVRCRVIS